MTIMEMHAAEATPKPCSKCRYIQLDTSYSEGSENRLNFAKCTKTGFYCSVERGSSGPCGRKAKRWDPVNEEDRPVAKYDEDTHTAVWDPALLVGFAFAVIGLLVTLAWLFGGESGTTSGEKKWRKAYYELSCSSRGLELNTRNTNYFCMDPKTKAIYEID